MCLAVIPYLNVSILYREIECTVEPKKENPIVSLCFIFFPRLFLQYTNVNVSDLESVFAQGISPEE